MAQNEDWDPIICSSCSYLGGLLSVHKFDVIRICPLLKFEVFNEKGVDLTSTGIDVITSFKTASVSCGTLADDSTDAIEITNTGGTSLNYDSSAGQYIQNWQTPSNSAGKCFNADLTTADGTHTVAYFKMTK